MRATKCKFVLIAGEPMDKFSSYCCSICGANRMNVRCLQRLSFVRPALAKIILYLTEKLIETAESIEFKLGYTKALHKGLVKDVR